MQDYLKYKGEFSNLTQEELIELYKKLENYKIKYRNHLGVPENISFGVEIEFQNTSLDVVKKSLKNEDEYKFWCIHEDASVEEYINGILVGGEISSDILYDTKDNWEKLKKLLNILKGLKAKAGDKTAFHTHVGAQIFKEDLEYAKRFIKLWCIFEDVIYRFGYGISSNPRELIEYYAYPIMPLYKKLYENSCRFDVIEVLDGGINHIKDAF